MNKLKSVYIFQSVYSFVFIVHTGDYTGTVFGLELLGRDNWLKVIWTDDNCIKLNIA